MIPDRSLPAPLDGAGRNGRNGDGRRWRRARLLLWCAFVLMPALLPVLTLGPGLAGPAPLGWRPALAVLGSGLLLCFSLLTATGPVTGSDTRRWVVLPLAVGLAQYAVAAFLLPDRWAAGPGGTDLVLVLPLVPAGAVLGLLARIAVCRPLGADLAASGLTVRIRLASRPPGWLTVTPTELRYRLGTRGPVRRVALHGADPADVSVTAVRPGAPPRWPGRATPVQTRPGPAVALRTAAATLLLPTDDAPGLVALVRARIALFAAEPTATRPATAAPRHPSLIARRHWDDATHHTRRPTVTTAARSQPVARRRAH